MYNIITNSLVSHSKRTQHLTFQHLMFSKFMNYYEQKNSIKNRGEIKQKNFVWNSTVCK